jgi:hypothetical protein
MKEYPSIDNVPSNGVPFYIFDKLDGQNIRAEWTRKSKRFVKFGKRHTMLDASEPVIGQAVGLIRDYFEKELTRVFTDRRWENVVAFFEFHGPNSFCGKHDPTDVLRCTMIDLNVYKKGIIHPRDYLHVVKDAEVDSAKFHGIHNVGPEFIKTISEGLLEGMAPEGVVCKGEPLKNGFPPHMFKLKTKAWIDRLRAQCKTQEEFQALL